MLKKSLRICVYKISHNCFVYLDMAVSFILKLAKASKPCGSGEIEEDRLRLFCWLVISVTVVKI